nr:MAG TPA: hypothetical protein [Caudoviricetes sp.]
MRLSAFKFFKTINYIIFKLKRHRAILWHYFDF